MTLILVCDYTRFLLRAPSDATTLKYQVTGASGFVGSHVVDEATKAMLLCSKVCTSSKPAHLDSKLTGR